MSACRQALRARKQRRPAGGHAPITAGSPASRGPATRRRSPRSHGPPPDRGPRRALLPAGAASGRSDTRAANAWRSSHAAIRAGGRLGTDPDVAEAEVEAAMAAGASVLGAGRPPDASLGARGARAAYAASSSPGLRTGFGALSPRSGALLALAHALDDRRLGSTLLCPLLDEASAEGVAYPTARAGAARLLFLSHDPRLPDPRLRYRVVLADHPPKVAAPPELCRSCSGWRRRLAMRDRPSGRRARPPSRSGVADATTYPATICASERPRRNPDPSPDESPMARTMWTAGVPRGHGSVGVVRRVAPEPLGIQRDVRQSSGSIVATRWTVNPRCLRPPVAGTVRPGRGGAPRIWRCRRHPAAVRARPTATAWSPASGSTSRTRRSASA